MNRAREDDTDFELVHAALLRFFPQLVCELGGDPYAMARRLGLGPSSLREDAPTLSCRAWIQLLELAAAELGCPDFGLRLASLQRGGRTFASRAFAEAAQAVQQLLLRPHLNAMDITGGQAQVRTV